MEHPKAFLIVATYNRDKWHSATEKQLEEAEDVAEELFPEDDTLISSLAKQGVLMARTFKSDLFDKVAVPYSEKKRELDEKLLPQLTELVQSAAQILGQNQASASIVDVSTVVQEKSVDAAMAIILREVRDQIVDSIYAAQPLKTPVGWVVAIDANSFASYMGRTSGKGTGAGIWSVFDLEILPLAEGWTVENAISTFPYPLREDEDTNDIYVFMTPTSWGH